MVVHGLSDPTSHHKLFSLPNGSMNQNWTQKAFTGCLIALKSLGTSVSGLWTSYKLNKPPQKLGEFVGGLQLSELQFIIQQTSLVQHELWFVNWFVPVRRFDQGYPLFLMEAWDLNLGLLNVWHSNRMGTNPQNSALERTMFYCLTLSYCVAFPLPLLLWESQAVMQRARTK